MFVLVLVWGAIAEHVATTVPNNTAFRDIIVATLEHGIRFLVEFVIRLVYLRFRVWIVIDDTSDALTSSRLTR